MLRLPPAPRALAAVPARAVLLLGALGPGLVQLVELPRDVRHPARGGRSTTGRGPIRGAPGRRSPDRTGSGAGEGRGGERGWGRGGGKGGGCIG